MSQRKDGRGHWPAGKRRHQDAGGWSRVRLALTRFLNANHTPGEISRAMLAADLGVTPRSVGRWIRGEDRPSEELQEAIAQWVAEWRDEIKSRKAS